MCASAQVRMAIMQALGWDISWRIASCKVYSGCDCKSLQNSALARWKFLALRQLHSSLSRAVHMMQRQRQRPLLCQLAAGPSWS
jgi:hypothetical protein